MRLIDADKLKKMVYAKFGNSNLSDAFNEIIDNVPTIVKCNKTSDGLPLMDLRPKDEWVEFSRWVAKEVLDDYFEDSSGAFAEIACRKLVKLGLVEVEDNVYKMKGDVENDT